MSFWFGLSPVWQVLLVLGALIVFAMIVTGRE
jgi:hypothetical protein